MDKIIPVTCGIEEQIFHSIQEVSQGFFKDRGSKFYAYAFPVESQEEVEEHLKEIKKKYHDARHHCYAYRLGMQGEKSFANDDGEPSHSAGTPILAAIRSRELSKTLVIVVRYFGGTKLGIRGLIEAYRTTALHALDEAKTYPLISMTRFSLRFSYTQTSELNKLLHPFEFEIEESTYTEDCQHIIAVRNSKFDALEQALQKAGYTIEILA